ncbi:hypothetical protein BDR06DRAFT_980753 [Suillus hirtellus]|nr:hypothetical protein BDR06DRAFT_980753 [Suillus hirtellus]
MDRRRVPPRPQEASEVECWSQASKSLVSFSNIYASPSSLETIGRVNRLISAWPTDDVLPAEGYDHLKTNYKRLSSALKDVQHINEEEVKAIDNVIEKLDVLIALRKAPEFPSQEKRNKRPRPPSPSTATATSVTPPLMSATRPMTTQVTSSRSSTGPSPAIPFSREPKARREALAKQLPLQEGRKVAFHPPAGKAADGSTADADETWILAVITKCINQDKNRYEVQDVEPQEDGQPGQCYNTTLRAIIPLPDPNASPTSAAHLNAYQEFPAGSTVMALYPDTSCFYRAEVISPPRDVPGRGVTTKTIASYYQLKFEDDDDQEHSVAAQWVVEWPKS